MARPPREKRQTRQERRSKDALLPFSHEGPPPKRPDKMLELKPKNAVQAAYLNSIKTNTLTFGLGPAGTGKTFVAAWYAADQFDKGEVDRIIVTRPAVEAGESLGFLPGDMDEKIDPYFAPVLEALERRLGKGRVAYAREHDQIVFVPLAFMRGRTFADAIVILDEAQNTTPKQMKMFLTRIGERAKVVVNGDLKQSDIPGPNGLKDAVDRISHLRSVGVCTFTRADVVRSGLAQAIVDVYEGEADVDQLPLFITRDRQD